jgi:hypothetical protein
MSHSACMMARFEVILGTVRKVVSGFSVRHIDSFIEIVRNKHVQNLGFYC